MENIKIVLLKPSEWEMYKAIRLEELREDPQAFGSNYEKESNFSDEQWQERPSNKNSLIFVAKDRETPIGLVGALIKQEEDEKIAHIWGMYVNSNYRGIRLGKRLMKKVLEAIQQAEVKKVQLMVDYEPTPAQLLYRSLGFQATETTDYILSDGKEHKLYIMEKEL
ncbi:MAG TPA: GNAT family N-acetyltransferase [Candidatus Saccharimonadales bacterium]|nr:GNAT family N-acetyltransferase [Candidatus Saccharimonadales bacterium]